MVVNHRRNYFTTAAHSLSDERLLRLHVVEGPALVLVGEAAAPRGVHRAGAERPKYGGTHVG